MTAVTAAPAFRPPPWQSAPAAALALAPAPAALTGEVVLVEDENMDYDLDHETFATQLALMAGLAAPVQPSGLGTPHAVGQTASGAPGSTEALAAVTPPQGALASAASKVPPMTAFGRVVRPRPRDSPYGSMLEEGQAIAAQAEALLENTQEYPERPEAPGGLQVKEEPASA